MKITHYGHACVLVEIPDGDGSKRVLIDPGAYSADFEPLRGLDLILITHEHPDHVDEDRVRALLAENPGAHLAGPAIVAVFEHAFTHLISPGDKLNANGVELEVTGGTHACIHSALPEAANNGYLIAGTVYHPGDAFDMPPADADVVFVPAGGPWMKLAEAIDYVRAVAPRVAIPIHQAGLAPIHQNMHHRLLTTLAPAGTEVIVAQHAAPVVA